VLGVSIDGQTPKDAQLSAIKEDGLAWPNVSDLQRRDEAAARLYGVKTIPQNLLTDRQGKIVARNLGGDDLEKKLGSMPD
jgi:hypothetical protein